MYKVPIKAYNQQPQKKVLNMPLSLSPLSSQIFSHKNFFFCAQTKLVSMVSFPSSRKKTLINKSIDPLRSWPVKTQGGPEQIKKKEYIVEKRKKRKKKEKILRRGGPP